MPKFNFSIVVTDIYELIIDADNYEEAEQAVGAHIDDAEYGKHLDVEVDYNLYAGPEITQVAEAVGAL
jgi:hypothetical protein